MQTEARQMLIGWVRHLGGGVMTYLVACGASAWALSSLQPGPARTLVILLPVLPGVYLIWVTTHLYRTCDEYVRLRILQSVAWAAGITAVWTMTYAFLEVAGLPRLSVAWVSNVGWAVFVGLMLRFIATHR
jgi:hypothetical protein